MRKSKVKNLKHIHMKDIEFFKALSNTGHITKEQAINDLKHYSSNKRLDTYIKNGIIEQRVDYWGQSYRFTQQGKEYVKNLDLGINYFQHPQSAYHDLKIANQYFSLSYDERESWKNETELKNDLIEYCNSLTEQGNYLGERYLEDYHNGVISIPDACYITETEETIIWEAITDSYGNRELQQKREYANVFKYEIQFSEK